MVIYTLRLNKKRYTNPQTIKSISNRIIFRLDAHALFISDKCNRDENYKISK